MGILVFALASTSYSADFSAGLKKAVEESKNVKCDISTKKKNSYTLSCEHALYYSKYDIQVENNVITGTGGAWMKTNEDQAECQVEGVVSAAGDVSLAIYCENI